MSGAAGSALGGLVLLAAGIYQLTPLKTACLSQCQSPLFFIHRHGGFRADAPGSFRLGLAHGAHRIGAAGKIVAARTDLAGPRRVRLERGGRVARRHLGARSVISVTRIVVDAW